MSRSSQRWKLFLGLLTAAAVFCSSYWTVVWMRTRGERSGDELAWLRHEFQLNEGELNRIRALHEGYKPQCQAMCTRIAEKNQQLRALVDGSTNVSAAIEQKLAEVAALRAECQAQMLRHFQAVSRSMPEPQGQRYLAEMQRHTLGLQDRMQDGMKQPSHEHR